MKLCHECMDVCTKQRLSVDGPHNPRSSPVMERSEICQDTPDRMLRAVQAMTDLLTTEGLICLDLADICAVATAGPGQSNIAIMGVGEASGPGRTIRAAEAAIADLKMQLRALSPATEA